MVCNNDFSPPLTQQRYPYAYALVANEDSQLRVSPFIREHTHPAQ